MSIDRDMVSRGLRFEGYSLVEIDGDDEIGTEFSGNADGKIVDDRSVNKVSVVEEVRSEETGNPHAGPHGVGQRSMSDYDAFTRRDIRRDSAESSWQGVEISRVVHVERQSVEVVHHFPAGQETAGDLESTAIETQGHEVSGVVDLVQIPCIHEGDLLREHIVPVDA